MALPSRSVQETIKWPKIAAKYHLDIHPDLADQIYSIDHLLSDVECRDILNLAQALKMEAPKAPGRNEAVRLNRASFEELMVYLLCPLTLGPPNTFLPADRFQTISPSFASTLFSLLSPHLSFLANQPKACSANIRLYRYDPGSFFGPHYDDSVKDESTGYKSGWTVLLYLTGEDEGVSGGETVFVSIRK